MSAKVRCVDCGLLSFVRLWESHELVGVTRKYRDMGERPPTIFVAGEGKRERYDDCPQCFVGAADLWSEKTGEGWERGYEVAKSERQCSEFIPNVPGLEPKEHVEMIQQKALLEWQRDREREDREWRECQAERERQWRLEDRRDAEAQRRDDLKRERFKAWAVALWTLFVSCVAWALSIYLPR